MENIVVANGDIVFIPAVASGVVGAGVKLIVGNLVVASGVTETVAVA